MKTPESPQPGPEVHPTYGGHDAVWVVTSCGHESHPVWWSCAICSIDKED